MKKPNVSFGMLKSSEMLFIEMVVKLSKEEAPEILKLYEEKLAIAR